uniref:Uncharacterized protein n=1 Tax=Arundo donax TaxID=35708 RepID=A0A0A9FDW6_ARUDO
MFKGMFDRAPRTAPKMILDEALPNDRLQE